jgi:hypothetical protein
MIRTAINNTTIYGLNDWYRGITGGACRAVNGQTASRAKKRCLGDESVVPDADPPCERVMRSDGWLHCGLDRGLLSEANVLVALDHYDVNPNAVLRVDWFCFALRQPEVLR